MKNIQVVKDFFSEDELKIIMPDINDAFDNEISKHSGKKTQGIIQFTKGVDGGSVDIERYQINPIVDKDVYEILKKRVNADFLAFYHFFQPGSHMGWHTEQGLITTAISIYLTEDWDRNWGGFICYKEEDEYKLEIPNFNKAVIQKAGLLHCVTPIYENCPIRKSIQIFLK
jgi:hypothetical protein